LREAGQGNWAINEARQLGHKSLQINGFLDGRGFLHPQVLKEQVSAGFQPGYRKLEQDSQPTNHAALDARKSLRSPMFLDRMRFLPTPLSL
jgi:hypothetical protein